VPKDDPEENNGHPFFSRKNNLRVILVDGRIQPLRPSRAHERIRKGQRYAIAQLAVAWTGILLVLGGLSVLFDVYPTVGIILLIIFLLGASLTMHDFWNATDAQAKQADKINFMKNMAVVGALLMLLHLPHPWPVSIRVDVAKH
jgi:uncharacterized membrane protein YphA (DoxX/SURF4 family)